MNNWAEQAAAAVAEGVSGCQVAIPDGKYSGDSYFVTDKDNKVLMIFAWDGARWVHPFEVMSLGVTKD